MPPCPARPCFPPWRRSATSRRRSPPRWPRPPGARAWPAPRARATWPGTCGACCGGPSTGRSSRSEAGPARVLPRAAAGADRPDVLGAPEHDPDDLHADPPQGEGDEEVERREDDQRQQAEQEAVQEREEHEAEGPQAEHDHDQRVDDLDDLRCHERGEAEVEQGRDEALGVGRSLLSAVAAGTAIGHALARRARGARPGVTAAGRHVGLALRRIAGAGRCLTRGAAVLWSSLAVSLICHLSVLLGYSCLIFGRWAPRRQEPRA